jgi:GT2 family glycosyltransferase
MATGGVTTRHAFRFARGLRMTHDPASATPRMGIVAIGRNEGERLARCLDSVTGHGYPVVYVDSGSTDGSVALAREKGAEVVELDLSTPFTAARARNTGLARLIEMHPAMPYVHFIDGDCEVAPGWLDAALAKIEEDSSIAAAWGLLVERYPEKSVYNRLADLEWRHTWPYGETLYCGGIALMRVASCQNSGLFNENLVAGEEPELCYRIRNQGGRIFRLQREMAYHDVAMTRFSQWWRRCVRSGLGYAEGAWMHGREPERYCVRDCVSIIAWAGVLPVVILATLLLAGPWALIPAAAYPLLFAKIARYNLSKGMSLRHAALHAAACVLAKFAHLLGMASYLWRRLRGAAPRLLEYK